MEIYNLELKQKVNKNFLKTVSTFANYNDGSIFFGINNDGGIFGLEDLDEAKLSIENMINDSIKPRPRFELITDFENKSIELKVYEGENKPYYFNNKAYKRSDSSDVEVDRYELNDLILKGKNTEYDALKSEYQDLSFDYFNEKAMSVIGIENPDLDLLRSFDLYDNKKGYNNAAYLLADKNNYKIIDFVKFGRSISDIEYRKIIENISILNAFDLTYDLYEQYYTGELIEGRSRNKYEKIPGKAFREALANALAHRRWDSKRFISISFFDDYIEIISPGGLPNGLSENEYLNFRVSSPRNPIISSVLYRFRYIDKLGTGIMRIKEAYENTLSDPKFEVSDNYIKVVLPVIQIENKAYRLDDDLKVIYDELKKSESLSRLELERITGFSKSKTTRIINALIDKNFIKAIGSGRSTSYKVI